MAKHVNVRGSPCTSPSYLWIPDMTLLASRLRHVRRRSGSPLGLRRDVMRLHSQHNSRTAQRKFAVTVQGQIAQLDRSMTYNEKAWWRLQVFCKRLRKKHQRASAKERILAASQQKLQPTKAKQVVNKLAFAENSKPKPRRAGHRLTLGFKEPDLTLNHTSVSFREIVSECGDVCLAPKRQHRQARRRPGISCDPCRD
ncbi:hypothetical protein Bbelb_105580 [Branchiostoma belcheri]|nr:hypothetical protein Bbelb_105580 [Branchiostoma belcheri]